MQKSSQIVINTIAVFAVCAILGSYSRVVGAQTSSDQLVEHQRAAQQAEARGDFGTAAREYGILSRAMPGSAELASNLGVALYFNHDLELARAAFHRAMHLNPALYSPHLFLGLVESREAKPGAAALELEKAIKINNADPMAHSWLAYAYIAQSRYQPAIEQLQLAVTEQPRDVDAAYALAKCYLELGKQATQMLLKAAPDGGRTWQLAAEQAELQGNMEKAKSFYLESFKRRPDIEGVRAKVIALNGSLPSQDNTAAVAIEQEDVLYNHVCEFEQKSKEAFEKVSAIDPDSYRTHEILADADVAADRFDDAILEYENVIKRKPDLPGIHGLLCNAFARTAQLDRAISECEAEVGLSEFSAEAYVHAARVNLLGQRYDQADALLQKAVKLNDPPISLYKYLGEVSFDKKQYQAAVNDLKKYLAVETKDASGFYLLSRAYKALGNTQGMTRAITTYKATIPTHAITNEAQASLTAAREDQALMPLDQKDILDR